MNWLDRIARRTRDTDASLGITIGSLGLAGPEHLRSATASERAEFLQVGTLIQTELGDPVSITSWPDSESIQMGIHFDDPDRDMYVHLKVEHMDALLDALLKVRNNAAKLCGPEGTAEACAPGCCQ